MHCYALCPNSTPWDPAYCIYNGYEYVWDELLNEKLQFDGPGYWIVVTVLRCTDLASDQCEDFDCPDYWPEGPVVSWKEQHDCKPCD